LDSRTRRCIAEALDAYQARLYLACANMLGAAFEGAWYAAGERLRTLDPRLSGLLDSHQTAKLERLMAEIIRRDGKGDKTLADELLSQAALLRELRNYGVHPRAAARDGLERYFSEPACGLLLLTTARHLTRLAEAVQRVVAAKRSP